MNFHAIFIYYVQNLGWGKACPSTDEYINKLCYISQNGILLSYKRNKLLIHAITWMKSQKHYAKWNLSDTGEYRISIWNSRKKTKIKWWKIGQWSPRVKILKSESTTNWQKGIFWNDILYDNYSDDYTTIHICHLELYN